MAPKPKDPEIELDTIKGTEEEAKDNEEEEGVLTQLYSIRRAEEFRQSSSSLAAFTAAGRRAAREAFYRKSWSLQVAGWVGGGPGEEPQPQEEPQGQEGQPQHRGAPPQEEERTQVVGALVL